MSVNLRLSVSGVSCLVIALLGVGPLPRAARAQQGGLPVRLAPNGASRNLLDLLQRLDYDTTQYVPIVVVNPGREVLPDAPLPEHLTSLLAIADAAHLRVVSPGRLNTLVPRTMTRINNHPGPANPFEGVSGGDALKLLTGTLTPGQWKSIGSTNGIGVGDLDPDQQLLWARIIDGPISVQSSTVEAGDQPGHIKYTDTTMTQITDTSAVRIRISKRVEFGFSAKGSDDQRYAGDPYHGPRGDTPGQRIQLIRLLSPHDPADDRKLYGQALLLDEENTDKKSDVDYASASLDPRISLHFSLKEAAQPSSIAPITNVGGRPPVPDFGVAALPTVADVIARINDATRLHFVADRRVRDLPVYVRGDSARSGDLLQAFARSVCGTFRKIPPSALGEPTLYLLTCDRDGVGAQVARLALWGEKAEEAKRAIEDKTGAQVAKTHPLSYLSFAADDSYAISPAQSEAIESRWTKEQYAEAPQVNWDDMSPKLQQGIRDYQQSVVSLGWNLRTDRVRIGEQLTASLIIPGVGAFEEEGLASGVGGQYIEKIAFDPSLASPPAKRPTAASTPSDPAVFPATITRRILVAAPQSPAEATALVEAAHARGFTDLDLQISLGDPAGAAHLLASAVKAGTASHLTVGATVSLLHNDGIDGSETERTILGQTGAEFGDTLLKESAPSTPPPYLPYLHRMVARYGGWTVARPDDLAARLAPIVAVPGLGSLTLRATAAPGYTGVKQGGDGLQLNAAFGYVPTTRRAFLLDYGIDPIDIPDQPWPVRQIKWNLGYFAEGDAGGEYLFVDGKMEPRPAAEVPRLAWWDFRSRQNKALLAQIYAATRTAHPTLPLFLDDRASPYVDVDSAWFGSWDAPERLPDYPIYHGASQIHTAGRAASKTLLALWGDSWLPRIGTKDDNPAYFASRVAIVAKANQPPAWDGLVVDLAGLPAKDVLRLLTGLPVAKP